MTTTSRNLLLLACCQALLLTNSAGLITMNGLVGYALAPTRALATLGVTTYVLGSALTTMPLSRWMARVGRRRGFMTGAVINVFGCALAALAMYVHSFALYCTATAVIGIYNAIGLQYRFAATEVAAPEHRASATSLVLAGGVVGGFLGPWMTRAGQHLLPSEFLGSFALLALTALVALALQSQVDVPPPQVGAHARDGRRLGLIARQPAFLVAALSGALGYGLMNLLMTATPLAMTFCAHPYGAAVLVIQLHVLGMYAPAFFTGRLIERFDVLTVIVAGIAVMAAGSAVALAGITVGHFVLSMVLVGLGWNFMYTGGTVLLGEAHSVEEKATAQGANDFLVFSTMGVSSLTSGALVSGAGWEVMNWVAIAVLVAGALGVLAFAQHRARTRLQPA